MPALNFERPLLALRAELTWLDQFAKRYASGAETRPTDWSSYVTPDPLVDVGNSGRSGVGSGPSVRRDHA